MCEGHEKVQETAVREAKSSKNVRMKGNGRIMRQEEKEQRPRMRKKEETTLN